MLLHSSAIKEAEVIHPNNNNKVRDIQINIFSMDDNWAEWTPCNLKTKNQRRLRNCQKVE